MQLPIMDIVTSAVEIETSQKQCSGVSRNFCGPHEASQGICANAVVWRYRAGIFVAARISGKPLLCRDENYYAVG